MKDKNGNEITNGCYLRIKYGYGKEKQLQDGIYKITLDLFRGISAKIVSIIEPELTLHTSLSWERGDLTFDYVNQNHDRLAVANTWGENTRAGSRWEEQHYSNDIELAEFVEKPK